MSVIIRFKQIISVILWYLKGEPAPPPHYLKILTVKKYAKLYSIRVFIETGTYLGQMIENTRNDFDKIYSIELDELLYLRAKEKFSKFDNITILKGDSAKILPTITRDIDEPILYWLDAHYSGGNTAKTDINTPILSELAVIFRHPLINKSILLIDDARFFTGTEDYPSISDLECMLQSINSNLKIMIEHDIIRVHM